MRQRRQRGFTLVELMIVVAITGILAALAIPAFYRYVKKSRSAEAVGHLQKMWAGATAYYHADHASSSTAVVPKQFPGPSAPFESATECGCLAGYRCPGSASAYSDPIWTALNFQVSDPHMYMPGFTSTGTGNAAQFTALAKSDLDCDGILSTFQRNGTVAGNSDEVSGGGGTYVVNEGE